MTKNLKAITPKVQRTIFHLEFKAVDTHFYYGSMSAIFLDPTNDHALGVSKFTVDRHDFDSAPYENDHIIIRKGVVVSSNDARDMKKQTSRS